MHILISGILGIIALLWIIFQVVGVISAVMEFFTALTAFIIGIGILLCAGIIVVIIGGIYFLLAQIDSNIANVFLIISVTLTILFAFFGNFSYRKKEDEIKVMNRVRYHSDKLSDDELMNFIENTSVDEFERIGYMAAFADRYQPRKNLLILEKS